MYQLVFTKGNTVTIIDEYPTLEAAKEAEREYRRNPEYCDGLITVERENRIF